MNNVGQWLSGFTNAILFFGLLLFIGSFLLLIYLYIVDKKQQQHAILRNFPIIGRFRYFFEHLGEFFRQYFFALDREELPFNRAQRNWVYRAAKQVDTTVAFGSTKTPFEDGPFVFANSAYPCLPSEQKAISSIAFGEQYAKQPYLSDRIINISAMSYVALSKKAISALAQGAKQAGIYLNTGEGGVSAYHLQSQCDLVFQIGTAKYGVRDENGQLDDAALLKLAAKQQIKMFEIKLSQGAKPGKGGLLPADKISAEIAEIRNIQQNSDSISPNRHADINNDQQLLDKIQHIRKLTGKPVGIKFVLGDIDWLDKLFSSIQQKGLDYAPDFITLDGSEGGTAAAPQPLMDFVGLPLEFSLPLLIDKLEQYQLRSRIKVIASGKLVTPSKIAWALCIGADSINSARGFMFALGCIQAMMCHKNTCPTGITTHNPKLQRGLVVADKAARVANYSQKLHDEVQMLAHSCGASQARALKRKHCMKISQTQKEIAITAIN